MGEDVPNYDIFLWGVKTANYFHFKMFLELGVDTIGELFDFVPHSAQGHRWKVKENVEERRIIFC